MLQKSHSDKQGREVRGMSSDKTGEKQTESQREKHTVGKKPGFLRAGSPKVGRLSTFLPMRLSGACGKNAMAAIAASLERGKLEVEMGEFERKKVGYVKAWFLRKIFPPKDRGRRISVFPSASPDVYEEWTLLCMLASQVDLAHQRGQQISSLGSIATLALLGIGMRCTVEHEEVKQMYGQDFTEASTMVPFAMELRGFSFLKFWIGYGTRVRHRVRK
ncbi:hypothetical protein ACLOJK_017421 [Asimina triloba]